MTWCSLGRELSVECSSAGYFPVAGLRGGAPGYSWPFLCAYPARPRDALKCYETGQLMRSRRGAEAKHEAMCRAKRAVRARRAGAPATCPHTTSAHLLDAPRAMRACLVAP